MSQPARLRDRRWYPVVAGLVIGVLWLGVMLSRDYGVLTSAAVALAPALITGWTEDLRRDRRLRGQRKEDMGVDYRAGQTDSA